MHAGLRGRRIIVLCEGDTEELAVRHFVTRQWCADGFQAVGLHTINLNGKLKDVGVKAPLFLDDPRVLAVFTLIDLCGMDHVSHSPSDSVQTKVVRVQRWLRSTFQHARLGQFFAHVCVHDIEAWVLAEGEALAKRLGDAGIQPDRHAEDKNFQKPPSARISELFLKNKSDRYQKIRDGRPLFDAMKFDPVYLACQYFRAFYDDLKKAAV